MGFWFTMVVRPILILAIVLLLLVVVFKGVADGKDSLLGLFKDYKNVKPVNAQRVSIIGTNPDQVWITKLDDNYWQGIDDDKNCRKDCDERCCFSIFFDREMKVEDFTNDEINKYMRVYEGLNYWTTPDNPGDWKQDLEPGQDYDVKLEDGKELVISGISEDVDVMIRFFNGNSLKSKDGKPLNEDTQMIVFELD